MEKQTSGRTIAIGDIHGCATALFTLLDNVDIQPKDLVVTLGDYIDRGPESHLVVERLLQLQSECTLVTLRGNHEAMLLDALNNEEFARFWLQCGGSATLMSYANADCDSTKDDAPFDDQVTDELAEQAHVEPFIDTSVIPERHIEFFRKCALAYETEHHLFLHANYDSKLPIDEQDEACLLWKHLDQGIPAPHVSGKPVFVGHTPQINGEVLDVGHLVCIDTFCFGGGWLTAIDVESKRTWQANDFGEVR